MEWNNLDRDATKAFIENLGVRRDAIPFSLHTTEVVSKNLPFYKDYNLYRVTNYATMPAFSVFYAACLEEDKENFVVLDGTAQAIYTTNEKASINLTETNVIDYLNFFFKYIQGPDGDIFLIKEPNDMPFLESLSNDQKESIISCHHPIKISSDVMPHSFQVSGTLYYDGGLISATIQVHADGKIDIKNQNLLLQGIHFPQNPVSYSWVAGD